MCSRKLSGIVKKNKERRGKNAEQNKTRERNVYWLLPQKSVGLSRLGEPANFVEIFEITQTIEL